MRETFPLLYKLPIFTKEVKIGSCRVADSYNLVGYMMPKDSHIWRSHGLIRGHITPSAADSRDPRNMISYNALEVMHCPREGKE